jgi:hypothetical protein
MFCHDLQARIDQAIKELDALKLRYALDGYLLSRRSFLMTLAFLPAADLITQCYVLKTILAWHVERLEHAEAYARHALHYSTIAHNTNLRLSALNQQALIAYYAKEFPKALAKSKEALAL